MDLVENHNIDINLKRHPWELMRFVIIKEKVATMLLNIPKDSHPVLVDIGCGDAFVVQKLYHEFFRHWRSDRESVFAIDINFTVENIQTLMAVNDKISYLRNISELKIETKNSYIVLLNDVIEHIEDHYGFIKLLDTIFDKASQFQLLITVPAFQHLFSNHDIALLHFRRYRVNQLQGYAKSLKMSTKDSGYFYLSLFIARQVLKIFEAPIDQNTRGIGVSNWNGGPLATFLYKSLLLIDYKLGSFLRSVGINVPGLSAFILMGR